MVLKAGDYDFHSAPNWILSTKEEFGQQFSEAHTMIVMQVSDVSRKN